MDMDEIEKIEFTINGQVYQVGPEVGNISLNTFIREHAYLKGTKFMCQEGACGACIVSVNYVHPSTLKRETQAVNSCQKPVLTCHGLDIITIEGIGNRYKGYHEIQKRIASFNGTQCGYCTPGMIMNMYSFLKNNNEATMAEIENITDNTCRCTGYRPILDAFKSFAIDASETLKEKVADIEDVTSTLNCIKCPGKCNTICNGNSIHKMKMVKPLSLKLPNGCDWYRPLTVKEIYQIFDKIKDKSYRFVAANTGYGLYKNDSKPEVYIDINNVWDLHQYSITSEQINLCANLTLNETINVIRRAADEHPNSFSYCKNVADHINLVGNNAVKNVGTLAGNLSLKHQHNNFVSDIFLLLETIGAQLVICNGNATEENINMIEYLKTDMKKKIIVSIVLPKLIQDEYIFKSYKIMSHARNSPVIVNAGIKLKIDKNFRNIVKATIIFGGINEEFVHAKKTEEFLIGKNITLDSVLTKALDILSSELKPDKSLLNSPNFIKGLALSLFYKFALSLNNNVNPFYASGGSLLERPLSQGNQDYETREEAWPLNKPIPKVEAFIQAGGEAEYTNDMPYIAEQLWGQLVLCDKACTEIESVDPSLALKQPGVVAFFDAKDIPGVNTFHPPRTIFSTQEEKIFATGKTDYCGQAVGLIVAESFEIAQSAAKLVKIKYGTSHKILPDAKEIIDNNIESRITEIRRINATARKDNVKHTIRGKINVPNQYHNYMELISCVSVPNEETFDIYPSSQWPSVLQDCMSLALSIPENKLNVRVKRLGGGFGGKITLPTHTAIVCTLASMKLNKPVRVVLTQETVMAWGGMRNPINANYEVAVDENGLIQHLNLKIYQDDGYSTNDSPMGLTLAHIGNCYDKSTWSVVGYSVRTDTASNTWCRGPGTLEANTITEHIIEHIAKVVNISPDQVRLTNMTQNHPCAEMYNEIKLSSDYDIRKTEVEIFNKNNRWKKRGISLSLMDFPFATYGIFNGSVTIYRFDGSVAVSHGGIEMGQGCNTKVAQVAAHTLGVDVNMIKVQPVTNFVSPNNFMSGASMTSEAACFAVMKACEQINERLKPVKEKLGSDANWLEIISEAFSQFISLRASYQFKPPDITNYHVYGAAVTEVECDILTGQFEILRVDLLEDTGESLNPNIDIGQIEGGFVMGIGLFTKEELKYDSNGKLLTTRASNYKPPGAKDIPTDFRITLKKNSPNPHGVLRSKATGEPPLCLSVSVIFAIRYALNSARSDTGINEWFDTDLPLTAERIWSSSKNEKEMFKLQ